MNNPYTFLNRRPHSHVRRLAPFQPPQHQYLAGLRRCPVGAADGGDVRPDGVHGGAVLPVERLVGARADGQPAESADCGTERIAGARTGGKRRSAGQLRPALRRAPGHHRRARNAGRGDRSASGGTALAVTATCRRPGEPRVAGRGNGRAGRRADRRIPDHRCRPRNDRAAPARDRQPSGGHPGPARRARQSGSPNRVPLTGPEGGGSGSGTAWRLAGTGGVAPGAAAAAADGQPGRDRGAGRVPRATPGRYRPFDGRAGG